MYRISSKTVLFITTVIWTAYILFMGSSLLNMGGEQKGAPEKRTTVKIEDAGEPQNISIMDKANNPFDMLDPNYERIAAQRINFSPEEKAVYIRDGTKTWWIYCDASGSIGTAGRVIGRYYKGVSYG
jgi:hypothetical protein